MTTGFLPRDKPDSNNNPTGDPDENTHAPLLGTSLPLHNVYAQTLDTL